MYLSFIIILYIFIYHHHHHQAETAEAIHATVGKLGLQMSFKKTEILPNGHQPSKSAPAVPLGNEGIIKVVDHFKYLGAYCSTDGTNAKNLTTD